MNSSEKLLETFRGPWEARLRGYLPDVVSKNPHFRDATLRRLGELSKLTTERVCLARTQALGLTCEPSALAERLLKLEDGREFIAGARFKNLDVNFPFVEIHKAFELEGNDLTEIQQKVEVEFAALSPKGLKFNDAPNLHADLEKWSHVLFGEVQQQPDVIETPDVKFEFSNSVSWHPQYEIEYRARLNEKPELSGFVRIGECEEFEEAAAANALLLVNDGAGFAGVIAAIESPLYGLDSIYMIESYLSKRLVGKKIAPRAHAHFFNGVAPRFKFVWGTIYDRNTSSLKTAQRMGRQIIETEYFVRFS